MSSNLFCLDAEGYIILFNSKKTPVWKSVNTFNEIKDAEDFIRNIQNITFSKADKGNKQSWIIYNDDSPIFQVFPNHNGWTNLQFQHVDWIKNVSFDASLADKHL